MNYRYEDEIPVSALAGKQIIGITGLKKGSEEVRIFTECGNEYMFFHISDCCEEVSLCDFDGEPSDLVGAVILSAEVVSNSGDDYENAEEKPNEWSESWTWTFYKIETNKGGLWMRWLGESNGYYSEEVDFVWVNKPETEQ